MILCYNEEKVKMTICFTQEIKLCNHDTLLHRGKIEI